MLIKNNTWSVGPKNDIAKKFVPNSAFKIGFRKRIVREFPYLEKLFKKTDIIFLEYTLEEESEK